MDLTEDKQMYEIQLTPNISRKLYSLVKNGVELVRSLSLVKAKTLINELNYAYHQKTTNAPVQDNQDRVSQNGSTSCYDNSDDRQFNSSGTSSSLQPSQSRSTISVDSVDRNDSYALCKSEPLSECSELCLQSKSITTREDPDRQTQGISTTKVRQLEFYLGAVRELSKRQNKLICDQHELVCDQHELVLGTAAIAGFAIGLVRKTTERQQPRVIENQLLNSSTELRLPSCVTTIASQSAL
jgi:hypothetical protein